jgi:hypothetical protein
VDASALARHNRRMPDATKRPDDHNELHRLLDELTSAHKPLEQAARAGNEAEIEAADKKVADIIRRIKQIQGL